MRIAIGHGNNDDILEAVKEFPFDIEIAHDKKELLEYINDPTIDGVIRGSLESNIITDLRKDYPDMFRASILEMDDYKFMLAPVGIDECDTIEAKKNIINGCCKIVEDSGHVPRVALISGGRKGDKGRSPKIDQTIEECEEIEKELEETINIKHYYILIEQAIKDRRNIIVAPDGIIGNILFRSLVLVCGVKSYGAVTLNYPKIFVDTSRSQTTQGYINSINMLVSIIESRRK